MSFRNSKVNHYSTINEVNSCVALTGSPKTRVGTSSKDQIYCRLCKDGPTTFTNKMEPLP